MRFSPRLRSALLNSKSPYLSSPSIGSPRCARWTRIWCVRPVRARPRAGSSSRRLASDGKWFSAACPSASTRTRRSPSPRLELRSASRTARFSSRNCPATARDSACPSRRGGSIACIAVSADRFFASSSTPEVSRSSRWTSSRNGASGRIERAATRSPRGKCRCRRGRPVPGACRPRAATRPRRGWVHEEVQSDGESGCHGRPRATGGMPHASRPRPGVPLHPPLVYAHFAGANDPVDVAFRHAFRAR